MATKPLIVIVGPTASGKSDFAIKLAQKLDGEIICADSRTVYKYLDIGSAKPSPIERTHIPHHVLDVVEPDETFTVADFKRLANAAIADIRRRDKTPIMVGGSGLYIDAVVFDYQFAPKNAPRSELNSRHLADSVQPRKSNLLPNTCMIGLDVPRPVLKERIRQRVKDMLEAGFENEVRFLLEHYPGSKALLAPGYKAFAQYIDGVVSMEDAKEAFIKNDTQLAKRQMTWFRRNKSIHWLSNSNTYLNDSCALIDKLS